VSARLFVAAEVAEEDRLALAAWAHEAVGADKGMRLVEPGQIHLTLAFLGHRPLEEIEPLSEVVVSLAGAPTPALRTAGGLWLSPRRPHVLTVAAEDEGGRLGELHERLWTGLEELGFEREKRRFRPHLTVARVRHGWSAPRHPLPDLAPRPLETRGIVLFRSWLGGGPARYEALVRAPLSRD
jgi:2'-5' RNA ligase